MIMSKDELIQLAKRLKLQIIESALTEDIYDVIITKDTNLLEKYLVSFKVVNSVEYKTGNRLYLTKEEDIEEYTICKNLIRKFYKLNIPYIVYNAEQTPNINYKYDKNKIHIIRKTSYKKEKELVEETILIYDPNNRVGELCKNE